MPTKKLRGFPPTTSDLTIRDVFSGSKINTSETEPSDVSDNDLDDVYGMGRKKSSEMGTKDIAWDKLGK